MAEFEILRAGPEHVEQAAPLFDAYRQYYENPPDLPAARAFLQERLANEESIVFLAQRGGEPVGFAQLYPTFSSLSLCRVWVLNDLYVADAERSAGAGAALLERSRAWAMETGARWMLLETANDNPARRLYERSGWEPHPDYPPLGKMIWYRLELP